MGLGNLLQLTLLKGGLDYMSSKDVFQFKSVIYNMKGSHKHKLKGF